jgi:Ca2+-binding EF-hand superfamily protein
MFDRAKSGKVLPKHIAEVAEDIGEYVTDDQLKSIMERGDKDNDGALNIHEFEGLLAGGQHQ